MKSQVEKRSVVLYGHKTSVSLEDIFWRHLKFIAGRKELTLTKLLQQIEGGRTHSNFSSALRLFVIDAVFNYTEEEKLAFDDAPPPPVATLAIVKPKQQALTRREWRKISRIARSA